MEHVIYDKYSNGPNMKIEALNTCTNDTINVTTSLGIVKNFAK